MIDLPFRFKKKRPAATEAPAMPKAQVAPKPRPEKLRPFAGGATEKAQDYLGGRDGERIGFRKPVQG